MDSEQDDDADTQIGGEDSSEIGNDHEEDMEVDPGEEYVNSPLRSSTAAISVIPAPLTTISSAVAVAVPASTAVTFIAVAVDPDPEIAQKPPADESRRLFQRLWTDEDEIKLLRGFLDYTTSQQRSGVNSYHHDTAAFYEQIKSKLQLDFNKNQLVEKLRRLKKKYRNAVKKINSGKEISFKSPHDQASFEISRKIWSATGKIIGFEDNVLDDEENHNHNITATTAASSNFNLTHCSNPNFEVKIEDGVERKMGSSSSNRWKKRSRTKLERIEEERRFESDGIGPIVNNVELSGGGAGDNGNHGGGGNVTVAAMVEETLRSCLTPMLREFMNGTTPVNIPNYGGSRGIIPPLILPPFPSNLATFGFDGMVGLSRIHGQVGERVDEKWRKQQILELEVYSRRLELVQDHIRLALAELRATGCGGRNG
ncbi:PREDICTED: probable transcription factor At3g04930 [Tarenaya hassleriana]|uniref:probable transcription factor At3g04930 n=1 Tax=Tarenaya hassleriana TaxID=28532 RepID=UPI00053C5993|nr:PREDICTED: probable transcription factor At3g04930 [Tarenaya hassleriana]